ncbi:hypothetical protein N9T76_02575 [Pseudomonadota bacterium]|nr:hypothetical protein [Pseudomonadota bacterium]
MKLFMVHVGFYDDEVGEGIYESHINIFVAAGNPKSAKKKIMSTDKFRDKKMHIDGIKEINNVDDYEVHLIKNPKQNKVKVYSYDESKKL